MSTTAATTYTIRVAGHLDDQWAGWLGDVELSRNRDGTSTITAHVADQAQLHGILAGLRDIGASLLELRTVDPAGVDVAGAAESGPHRLR